MPFITLQVTAAVSGNRIGTGPEIFISGCSAYSKQVLPGLQ
jgi:hypothetical protein